MAVVGVFSVATAIRRSAETNRMAQGPWRALGNALFGGAGLALAMLPLIPGWHDYAAVAFVLGAGAYELAGSRIWRRERRRSAWQSRQ